MRDYDGGDADDARFGELLRECNRLRAEMTNATSERDAAVDDRDDLLVERDQLRAELEREREDANREVEAFESSVRQLRAELERVTKERDALLDEATTEYVGIRIYRDRWTEATAELERVKALIGERDAQLATEKRAYVECNRAWQDVREMLLATQAERDRVANASAQMHGMIEAFVSVADGAVRAFESRGKGGQHVPYHDDFASGPPSTISALRRWVRDFRSVLPTGQLPDSGGGK